MAKKKAKKGGKKKRKVVPNEDERSAEIQLSAELAIVVQREGRHLHVRVDRSNGAARQSL